MRFNLNIDNEKPNQIHEIGLRIVVATACPCPVHHGDSGQKEVYGIYSFLYTGKLFSQS
jgi:GTP cyclohydrolase FolE2